MEREATFRSTTGGGASRQALLWAAALLGIAGVAYLGGRLVEVPRAAVPAADAIVRESTVHADPGPLRAPVMFVRPTRPFEEITTPGILVAGRADPDVDLVTVRLEARGGRIIGRVVVPTVPSAGGGREFVTTLDLPSTRPNGTMWVRLEPTDRGPVLGIRIAVRIGPNLGAIPAVPGPWAPLGEDGFIGNVGAR